MPAGSIRARVRAEMIDEIKTVARRHLATDGANLSLRAVARDMGMVSSALYRYFASRDDLLTALIIDAYNGVGDAVEAAPSNHDSPMEQWLSVCHAVRDWALANPAEYALIYGSPVPGYVAPQDTIVAAVRTPRTLLKILAGSEIRPGPLPEALNPDIQRAQDALGFEISPAAAGWGSVCWIHLFGAVSFELFGQLNNIIEARREYFEYQMRTIIQISDTRGGPDRPSREAAS